MLNNAHLYFCTSFRLTHRRKSVEFNPETYSESAKMQTAFKGSIAFILGQPPPPAIDFGSILVPLASASLIVVATFCVGFSESVKRILLGLAAVLILYPIATMPFPFAPRTSVVVFSLVVFPVILVAYAKAWRRLLVSTLAVAGIAALYASPVDITVAVGAEKKGIFIVPVTYSMAGGFHGSTYSRGCLPDPPSVYTADYILVLSV